MENGEWRMENGEWRMGAILSFVSCGETTNNRETVNTLSPERKRKEKAGILR